MKKTEHDIEFDDFFDSFRAEAKRPPHVLSILFGMILVPVFGGILVALAMTPLITPVPAVLQSTQNYWDDLPTELPEVTPPQRSVILDVNGDEMTEFFAENRILVELDDVSPHVVDALIAVEDQDFYTHGGVDYQGVVRALVTNVTTDATQGASTITQQLVKNTLLVTARDFDEREAATAISTTRKIQEVRYALELEDTLSKDEILERYLNLVLYSNGVYGIGTAADFYFSKDVADLNVAESALLIGLLRNPTGYDPLVNPDRALDRRATVLWLMHTEGKIDEDTYDEARESDLGLNINRPENGCPVATDPYYCQWVLDDIRSDPAYGETPEEREDLLYWGGLEIHTYYDPEVASEMQTVANNALGKDNRVATSISLTTPGTGAVPAFAQNREWGDPSTGGDEQRTEVIYADRTSFQSGSVFKIFTLLAALEEGFSPDTVMDAPQSYTNPNMNTPPGGITNNVPNTAGPMDAYTATARSSNTWYAMLQERVGVLAVADMAESMGIEVPREGPRAVTERDASFTLGTISVSPLQMSAATAAIASGGIYCEPHGVSSIIGPNGEEIPSQDGNCRRVMSVQTATTATDILQGVIQGDDPDRTAENIEIDRPVAGKTGTTNRSTEVWFTGFVPQLAVSVWVGDPRGPNQYPLSQGIRYYGSWTTYVYGSSISAPIWQDAMERLLPNIPSQNFPRVVPRSVGSVIPDVRGLDVDAAVNTLLAYGHEVEIAEENREDSNSVLPPNVVYSQSPAGGPNGAARTTTITLTLTAGSEEYEFN